MNPTNYLILSTSPLSQLAKKSCGTASLNHRQRFLYGRKRHYSTGKEYDTETGLYYYGARYLDSKTSRWLSGDPAMGEYVPSAPVDDEARKRNGSLPGMGGVFNYVNLHVYHYAGNNPVKLVDPDGRDTGSPLSEDQWNKVSQARTEALSNLNLMIRDIGLYANDQIDNLSPEIVQGAKDWLGIDINDKKTAMKLADDLEKIRDNLASKSRDDFRVLDPDGGATAMVYPLGKHIHLYPDFFELSDGVRGAGANQRTKQGTLVHEATHFFAVFGTNFFKKENYLYNNVRNLPTMRNAQNWRFFFEGFAFR